MNQIVIASIAAIVVTLQGCTGQNTGQPLTTYPRQNYDRDAWYEWFHIPDCSDGFDAEADITKGDVHLIMYGLPNFEFVSTEQKLAKLYGFYFANRGCVVSGDEFECADIYNKKVIEFLSARNGEDWYQRFNQSLDSARLAFNVKNGIENGTPYPGTSTDSK